MAFKDQRKVSDAVKQLEKAINLYEAHSDDNLYFLMLAKAFEVLMEYVWKELKFRVEDEGLEANSPKEAIRQAAVIKIIDDPDRWIACINARNDSVHDYFGIPRKDYLVLVRDFLEIVKEVRF